MSNCKHNNMSQVLPGLWIGGTNKHTEPPLSVFTHGSRTRYVRVVETAPSRQASFTRYFVCQNYSIPSVPLEWWIKESKRCDADSLQVVATVVTDLGGHGRSGLYCAIIMAAVLNISGQEAIARLRQLHCKHAVETPAQEAYVIRIVNELKDWKG